MFTLTPLGDLTRFISSNIKNEVYIVTEDRCIKSNGVLLAARSAKIEEILEEGKNIPGVHFSDNMAGLEDCLDLAYGGSVDIREDNFKSIYKFGKLFQICEMIAGVLAWIVSDVTYDKFWKVYLDLKNLHEDISLFVDMITGYLSTVDDNFMELTTELCRSQDKNTITAVVELLSRIDDIRVLSVMENIIDTATENNATLVATTSSTNTKNYLQTVVSSTVTYIENFLRIKSWDFINKFLFTRCINKVSSVCTNIEMCKRMIILLTDQNKMANTVISIKDLNWVTVKLLTSPLTSYDAIKYFAENAGAGIHPCVMVEIVLKWWRVRTGTEHVDMSFITPLVITIQNVSSWWYYSVCGDERYKGLIKTLNNIPEPTAVRYIYYRAWEYNLEYTSNNNYKRVLRDCIRKGDGTPAQLEELMCSDNMKRYRQIVPAFTYNAAVFPPYGDTKHHWYIITSNPFRLVSLITDSKEEILNCNTSGILLFFVPLSDTLQ